MCGIAGFVDNLASAETRTDAVARMCGAMVHRGPDDSGIESAGAATLGMRRLAIFDPANGHQPMLSPDHRYTLVFNGAIYNFRELREQLAAHWVFRTQCDTEVLLAAYVRWGADCLLRLRGMFAFAVWDVHEQSLFFARDPFGIKPLYYRQEGRRFIFASELNGLRAGGVFAAEIDGTAVGDFLAWLAVPAPRTIYRGVFSLRPGECGTFQNGRLETRSYWSFRAPRDGVAPCRTRGDFIAALRERLEDSVQAHLAADVPVGAFLSGGLDSAGVTGLMTRLSDQPLRTFSIDFAEPEYSEAAAAEATARHFGTVHHTTVLTGVDVARDIGKLVSALDQPTGDGVNTYYASQAARAGGVKVALSGLGGDELFGGYPSFRDTPRLARWLRPWRALPRPVRAAMVRRLARGDTRRRKLGDVLQHARNIHEVGALQRRVFSAQASHALLSRDLTRALGEQTAFHPALATLERDLEGAAPFEVVSAWELRTYMADVLLRDSDVMSMSHSLELRVPLVDRPLAEWLRRQPAEFKSNAQQPKAALAEALADLLPPGLAGRRKQGFSLPLDRWMKNELRPFLEDTFSDDSIARSGFFNRTTAQNTWRGFLAGHDTREWSRVWSLGIMIAFANRRTLGGANPAVAPIQLQGRSESASGFPAPFVARKPVRTLLLAPQIFASEGGIARILQTYLKALSDIAVPGDELRLLALNDAEISTDDLEFVPAQKITGVVACNRSKFRFVHEALRLSRDCDRIVCGHIFQLPVAWLAGRLYPRLRYYLVAHGIEIWRPFRWRERVALRGAARIFCVSDYTRHELLKHCPLPAEKAVVLHNALDASFPIGPGKPLADCPPVILTVTRMTYADRYKGVQHLIESMPAIRATIPDARLKIIGRGDDVARLTALRDQLALGPAVEFTGFVNDARLSAEMQSCRLFALPSRKEGFGLVFLEAMAHGRPCLGARAGGVPEVISEDTGMLVEYGDVSGIARAGITALQRPWSEAAILARARHFSYPRFKSKLAELLA